MQKQLSPKKSDGMAIHLFLFRRALTGRGGFSSAGVNNFLHGIRRMKIPMSHGGA
jgi:hypothetical protein